MAITIDGADNKLEIGANATGPSSLRLYEDTDNGTNYVSIIAPSAVTSNRTITLPDATGTLVTNSGSEAGAFSTLAVNSNNISAENSLGFRNRIINGDMRIDQRRAGASVTITDTANFTYTIDRWAAYGNNASKFSVQQVTDAPSTFVNSLKVTSLATTSLGSSDQYSISQQIEGLNVADLAWGTANAKTITLSFWVRSSLTGTFGGVVTNSALNRAYGFTYAISAADTWEQKSITIAGDTTGTWLTTNGVGIRVYWGLGVGTTLSLGAGSWTAGGYRSVTGATSVVGTNGATLNITGVQLEVGSVATPFERRDYGRELAMCQRYYEVFGDTFLSMYFESNAVAGSFAVTGNLAFATQKRATPTMSTSGSFNTLNTTGSLTFYSSVSNFGAFYLTAGAGRAYWYNDSGGKIIASIEL
jgi:hypothetical protein